MQLLRCTRARAVFVAAAFVALCGAPASAGAAAISKITYDVTGGTFPALLTGPVVGGTLSLASISPSGVSTPISFNATGLFQLTHLSLLANTGTITITNPGGVLLQTGMITANAAKGTGSGLITGKIFQPGTIFFGSVAANLYFSAISGAGFGSVVVTLGIFYSTTPVTFPFTIGNEVRTLAPIPEPSTAPLAGLGLLALSGYAARRRVRRIRQRA